MKPVSRPNSISLALGAFALSAAWTNAQSISHVATTQLNNNGDSFGISVVAGDAKYKRSTGLGEGTGVYGDGTLLDWRIHTGVNNENPFLGAAVSAGPGTYFDIPVCTEIVGAPQNWLKVYTAADIDVAGFAGADITTGTVPQIGSSAVPLTGNIAVSRLTDGQFYVVAGAFSQTVTINLTMTGPGQTPLTASHVIGSPGSNNRLHSVEFSFSNPGGNYYNIAYSVNHGGTLARRRAGGVLLDGTLFVDAVEPAWVATWPNAGPVSSTLFTLNGNANEDSTAYYVVLPDGASAPTSAQVKAGNDASSSPAPFSGNFAMGALVPGSEMVTGLTASTAYDVYLVAEDIRGPNLQATPVLIDVTTTPPDVTEPGWTATYPQVNRTPAGLTGIANINEPGTAYFVVLPSGAPAPTSAQVKAGNDASDSAAPFSGDISLLSPGVSGTDAVNGLSIGTTYDVYFAAEDLEGNLQTSPQWVISAPVAPVSQFATGGFAWGTASAWSNATSGPYTNAWGSGNHAVFEGTAGVVPVVSGTIANDMTFSSGNFILQGGPLSLIGTTQPTITVSAGIPKLETALAGTQGFIKSGSGTLQMTGSNTALTGGIVISQGFLGDNGGALGTASLNNNQITANGGTVGLTVAGGATTDGGITLTSGILRISNNNSSFTVNGAVTGSGGIELNKTGGGQNLLNLSSTSNNFTGGVDYTSDLAVELNVNSFADTASPGTGNIRFGLGNPGNAATRHRFALNSGATSPLALTNRRFEITSANNYLAQIYNNSAQAFTIHSDLLVSGTNTKTLELGGTGAGTSTFAGDLSNGTGTLLLNKSGTSTWVLSGDNTYTGATTVSAGSLIINGDQSAATGAVAVNGTSTLGGSGTTGGTITVAAGAKLAPGNAGVGNLATGGGLNISAMAGGAGTLVYELNSTAASDKITVAGTLNIGSGSLGLGDFAFTNLGGMSAGTYKLITGASPASGTLDATNTTGTLDDFDLELAINGNDIELVVTGGPDNDFTDWAATFLPTVIGSPLDDHDGDGLSNDEERAFGLNPTSGSSSNPISVPLDTTNGTFTFTRRDPTISGLTYQVWTSTDLADWEVDGGALFTPGTVVDQVEPVAVQLSAGLLSEPKLFFRITYAEPVPAPPLLSVDFEANAGGFTVATLGGTPWAHGAPNSPSLGGGAITSGAGGSTQCWGTNLTGGYAASTDTSLRSPVIDLTSVTAATLSFAQAIDSNSGHTLEVNIIDDTTDTVIANIIPATQDGNTSVSPWETVAPVALPGAAYGQAVRIEWRFIGNGDGTYNGAYIDDVTVLATP